MKNLKEILRGIRHKLEQHEPLTEAKSDEYGKVLDAVKGGDCHI